MSKRRLLCAALAVACLPAIALAAAVDTRGVTPLDPGQWSMHEHGVIHVMGMNRSFDKTGRTCVRRGEKRNPGIPTEHGRCRTHETTGAVGVKHWTMNCKAGGAVMRGAGTGRIAHRHFTSHWWIVGGNPAIPRYTRAPPRPPSRAAGSARSAVPHKATVVCPPLIA